MYLLVEIRGLVKMSHPKVFWGLLVGRCMDYYNFTTYSTSSYRGLG